MKDKSEEQRNLVCDQHLQWLRDGYAGKQRKIGKWDNVWVIENISQLHGKLACHCGDKRCHVDNLIKVYEAIRPKKVYKEYMCIKCGQPTGSAIADIDYCFHCSIGRYSR